MNVISTSQYMGLYEIRNKPLHVLAAIFFFSEALSEAIFSFSEALSEAIFSFSEALSEEILSPSTISVALMNGHGKSNKVAPQFLQIPSGWYLLKAMSWAVAILFAQCALLFDVESNLKPTLHFIGLLRNVIRLVDS